MRQAWSRHRRDVVLIVSTALAGLAVVAYILGHQTAFRLPSWLPGSGGAHYTFQAEFTDVSGIVPGQAQPVAVAGVQVGVVSGVKLDGQVAVVTLDLDPDHPPIYHDATLLVRPRTALKDMFVALDPGDPSTGALPEGGRISVSQTQPTVNVDEVLSNLDQNTRSFLRLLLAGGAGAFRDPGSKAGSGAPSPRAVSDLRRALTRLQPVSHDTRRVTAQLGRRRENLRHVIHGLDQVTVQLSSITGDISNLVAGADKTFQATGSRDTQLAAALSELPGTLAAGDRALSNTEQFGRQLGLASASLQPLARSLAPAEQALQPFARETTPIVSDELRPFARTALPVLKTLKPAAVNLGQATPPAAKTLSVFSRFLNAEAFNPPGNEQGYLFWAAWLSHNANSLTALQDSHGAAIRALPMATCSQLDALHQVELGNPSLSPIIKLINLPDRLAVCH
jgi:phospholipid/cholesterol/gamma-HCH transport system substrate-binding protein